MRLTILYRGPLSSCNYDCYYCPFAKRIDNPEQLANDRECLKHFVDWCERSELKELSVFFTPWGEALTRKWYWEAFRRLTNLTHVKKVAVQTNLSANLSWIDECDRSKIGIWATYHPSQANLDRFMRQVNRLQEFDVSHSVGVVGLREDFRSIDELRVLLPESTYLWVNAFKRQEGYYEDEEIEWLKSIDPWFGLNAVRHPSLGMPCRTGQEVISVDGNGDIRRCHFVKSVLGNLYQDSLEHILQPRPCPNETCGCYIGYSHLDHLQLDSIFADGILERAPSLFSIAK